VLFETLSFFARALTPISASSSEKASRSRTALATEDTRFRVAGPGFLADFDTFFEADVVFDRVGKSNGSSIAGTYMLTPASLGSSRARFCPPWYPWTQREYFHAQSDSYPPCEPPCRVNLALVPLQGTMFCFKQYDWMTRPSSAAGLPEEVSG
jgi:hypothetical protein